jgi:hypothetical protein
VLTGPRQGARGTGDARIGAARAERRKDSLIDLADVIDVVHVDSLFPPAPPELRQY